MTTDTASPRDQHANHSGENAARPEIQIARARKSTREEISEAVAEDHARLLTLIAKCLGEIGIRASLTTFHRLVLRANTYHAPARYEPELDVFWPDEEQPGIALTVKLTERGGQTFYCWGMSWACAHPANDPLGAIQVIADAVQAA